MPKALPIGLDYLVPYAVNSSATLGRIVPVCPPIQLLHECNERTEKREGETNGVSGRVTNVCVSESLLFTFVQQNVNFKTHIFLHFQFDSPEHNGYLCHFLNHVSDV